MVGDDRTIRDAGPQDIAPLTRLFGAYLAFYSQARESAAIQAFLADRIEKDDTKLFVARVHGEHVGFVHLLPTFDTLALRPAWILEDLFVAPSVRHRGIGSMLLQRAEDFARAEKAARLTLTTAHDNFSAQRLYLAHGYERDERFRTFHRVLA